MNYDMEIASKSKRLDYLYGWFYESINEGNYLMADIIGLNIENVEREISTLKYDKMLRDKNFKKLR